MLKVNDLMIHVLYSTSIITFIHAWLVARLKDIKQCRHYYKYMLPCKAYLTLLIIH